MPGGYAASASTAEELRRDGTRLAALRSPELAQQWVRRRTDAFKFLDHATAERHVSLDIDLNWVIAQGYGVPRGNCLLVPIASLSRAIHSTIRVEGDAGCLLARLNKTEERALILEAALTAAEEALRRPPSQACREIIRGIIEDEREIKLLDTPSARTDASKLFKNEWYTTILSRLRNDFFLIACIPIQGMSRRVITYSYIEQPIEDYSVDGVDTPPFGRRLRAMVAGIAWPTGSTKAVFEVRNANDAATYHVQLEAPFDLELHNGRLMGMQAGKTDPAIFHDDDLSLTTAHATCTPAPFADARFSVDLALVRTGMTRASVLASLGILVSLVFSLMYVMWNTAAHLGLDPDRSAATSVLLLAPAALAAVVASPSRHTMTTHLLLGTRLTISVCCVASFVAAAAFSFRFSKPDLQGTLIGTVVVAALCMLRLTIQLRHLGHQGRLTRADIEKRLRQRRGSTADA